MNDRDRPHALVAALDGARTIVATLPPLASCPRQLVQAVEAFEPMDHPSAIASGAWLRDRAFLEHGSARTYVWVARGRVHGFFAVSVGTCRLQPHELATLQAGRRPMPAVLLAQAARARECDIPPNEILETVLGIAEEVAALAGAGALMLDPFDQPTEQMWRARGFRSTSDTPRGNGRRRLWIELGTS